MDSEGDLSLHSRHAQVDSLAGGLRDIPLHTGFQADLVSEAILG